MKKKNESKMAAVLVSMGLCVVALGAGMTYYTWSNVKEPLTAEESPASPVTVAKSPTLDTAKAQREQMSNDDGEECGLYCSATGGRFCVYYQGVWPWGRHEPVRRKGIGGGRHGLPRNPQPLLHRHFF